MLTLPRKTIASVLLLKAISDIDRLFSRGYPPPNRTFWYEDGPTMTMSEVAPKTIPFAELAV